MNKTLVFDMDGTLADLYGVENWLDDLNNYDPRPYEVAEPMYDMAELAKVLNALKKFGYMVVITSWLSKVTNDIYNDLVREAKREWLDRMGFPYDELHFVKYGTTKANCTRKKAGYQILFDDNEKIRKGWHLGEAVDANEDIFEYLKNLLDKAEKECYNDTINERKELNPMINENEFVLVLDTETTNNMDDPLFYDCGFAVVNPYTGEVVKEYSYINKDVFYSPYHMQSAYYLDKVPQYLIDIVNGSRKVCSIDQIKFAISKVMKYYGITKVFAHNARFDYKSTNTTLRYITKSADRYLFPYGTEFGDTLKMAREVFGKDAEYRNWCEENGFMTANHQPRMTAEVLHRYLANDVDFNEAHTGLEDVLIEKDILCECLKRKPDVNWKLWNN